MKNLNQRSKILIAIAAVVVVVAVIAVIVFSQVEPAELAGASVVGVSPSNPTIVVGGTVTLSASTSLSKCSWSSANTAVATLVSNGKSAVVTGKTAGQVRINVKCGLGLSTGSTTVTVNPAPTPTPTPTPAPPPVIRLGPDTGKSTPGIGYNERMTLCTGDSSVRWDIALSTPANAVTLLGSSFAPGCIVAQGNGPTDGDAVIRATNAGGGTATVTINVRNQLTMSPAYPTISVGQSITISMAAAGSGSPWRIFKGCENVPAASCPVRLSATSGQSVTITGQVKGVVFVSCNKVVYDTSTNDMGLTQVIVQ